MRRQTPTRELTMEHFNRLTPAELERLAILAEECGEVVQAVNKIIRHGYATGHPDHDENNRFDLEKECGDVRCAMIRLCEAGDLDKQHIHNQANYKAKSVLHYLHHND